MAQDPAILPEWFKLFQQVRQEFDVSDENIWNMDEKGVMQEIIAKTRVIVGANDRKKYMTQPGNREWLSSIECISMAGKSLRS